MNRSLSRRTVLKWVIGGGVALVVPGCRTRSGARPNLPLKARARLGLNHPIDSISSRERQLGYAFPIVGGIYYSFDTIWNRHPEDLVPAVGRELMICWMPQRLGSTVLLADIQKGHYDAHLDQMLLGMRSVPGPVICRWGHEPNGFWYPWSAAYRGRYAGCFAPTEFVNAWRYVVSRERAIPGDSNIRWFWCANGSDRPSPNGSNYPLETYWPGDSWVDIVGCDGYNEPGKWESFDAVFADPYARISRLSDKPFWIGEVGCHEPLSGHQGSKGEWIEAMLNSTQFPNLQALCYFDFDATANGRADWRFDSTKATLASVAESFASVPAPGRDS